MQFNSDSDNQDIISDITFLLGLDTNAYTLKDRTRNVNERFKMVWQMIFESYGGWQFIDDNTSDASTGVPYTDTSITSGTGLYAIPSAALTINAVSLLMDDGSTRAQLQGISHQEFESMGGDSRFSSNAVPLYYLLQGDVLRLLPTPNYTEASALRVYFDQGIAAFASTDTTKVPGFASPFHRMLSVGASLDYAMSRNLPDKVTYLQRLWDDYERRIKMYYSKRFKDRFPQQINPGRDIMMGAK